MCTTRLGGHRIHQLPDRACCPPPATSADFNADGVIDAVDLQMLLEHFGERTADHPDAARFDLTHTGAITRTDLADLLRRFGDASAVTDYVPFRLCECMGLYGWVPINLPCCYTEPDSGGNNDDPNREGDDASAPGNGGNNTNPDGTGTNGDDGSNDSGDTTPACAGKITGPKFLPVSAPGLFNIMLCDDSSEPDSVQWATPTPAGMVQVKSTSLMSPTLSLIANDIPGEVNLQATVFKGSGQPCIFEFKFFIGDVRFLDMNMGEINNDSNEEMGFLDIGHWGDDAAGNQLTGYTSNGAVINTATSTFIDVDPDRFFIQVWDGTANADPEELDLIEASIQTLRPGLSESVDDAETMLKLKETDVDTGVFKSESLLLMSPDLPPPAQPDDDLAVWSKRSGLPSDNAKGDRTHRAMLGGKVKAAYTPPEGAFPLETTVQVGEPSGPMTPNTLRLRVHVHLEPYMDVGIPPGVGDPDPFGFPVGANNGVFDLNDLNNNGVHDAGEPSEPYLDLSVGVQVQVTNETPLESFYHRGDEAPSLIGDGRGPVVTNQHVADQIARANIAWAQAGIHIVMVEGPIIEEAPRDANGEDILENGWFDFTASEHFAMLSSITGATPSVAEVIFTGPIRVGNVVGNGLTSIPLIHGSLPNNLANNTYILMAPNLDIELRTLAHEIGHALTNQIDTPSPPYIFFPTSAAPTAAGDLAPWLYRRVLHATDLTAHQIRSCLSCPGNTLLVP